MRFSHAKGAQERIKAPRGRIHRREEGIAALEKETREMRDGGSTGELLSVTGFSISNGAMRKERKIVFGHQTHKSLRNGKRGKPEKEKR